MGPNILNIYSLNFTQSPLLSFPEAHLDLEDDGPVEKEPASIHAPPTQEPQSQQHTVIDDQSHESQEPQQREVEVRPEEEEPLQLQSTPEEQFCQSTVAEQDPDEDRVSSTNEGPKDSESEVNTSATQVSDTSPTSKRSAKEDLDYSSYDNGG